MDFGAALQALNSGERVQRTGWNGKGMYLYKVREWQEQFDIDEPEQYLFKAPFIAMKTADNMIVPWLASQTDILATDWQLHIIVPF